MASNNSTFGHRLGHRDVDCERGYGCDSSGKEIVARDDEVLSETGRRRCTNSDRKHPWRRPYDAMRLPRNRPMTPPPNQFRKQPTTTSQTLSDSFPSPVPLRQTLQSNRGVSLTYCRPPQDARRTLSVTCELSKPDRPHRRATGVPQVARLPISYQKPEEILCAGQHDGPRYSLYLPAPQAKQQNSSFSAIPTAFDLHNACFFQAEGSVPNTFSEVVTTSTGNIARQQGVVAHNGISVSLLKSSDRSQRLSVFSFPSQNRQSFAASLTRLEKTILRYERAILEILSAHTSLDLSRAISPQDTAESELTAIQAILDTVESDTNEMSNPFRSLSGLTTPKKPRDTPPRAIFSDLPEAHSAIIGAPAARGGKLPSPTPGMPSMETPYAKLPPTIDLPESPAKHTGGPADEEIKCRIASSEFPRVDVPERLSTPLLPPTPVFVRPERRESPSLGIARLFKAPFLEETRSGSGIGREDYELKVLKRDGRHDRSSLDEDDGVVESPKSLSSFGLETPSRGEVRREPGRERSRPRRVPTDVHQSSTLSSILGAYNDHSESIRMREGSQRSVEISTSHEISSLSADDECEIPIQGSTAGHTPPLDNITFGRQPLGRSTSGQPPRDPLPALPARQAFGDTQDVSESEPTTYGNTQDLLNVTREREKNQVSKTADSARCHGGRSVNFNPAGPLTPQQTMLTGPRSDPVRSDISSQERRMTERLAGHKYQDIDTERAIGKSDGSVGPGEELTRPLAYTPTFDGRGFAVVGRRPPLHSAVDEEEEEEGEPVRLLRRPQMIPGPDGTYHRQTLDPGGPQSSSSQNLSAYSSFGQDKTASGRFQHDETLASLTGKLPSRSYRNMESLINDVGALFGEEEEQDGAVFDNDVSAGQGEKEDDDGDWETVHESGLRTKAPHKSMTNRDTTATSLANVSSYGSLTGSVPATPWGPLTGRGHVLTYPSKAGLQYRRRARTDTETGRAVMSPEYETSDELFGYDENEKRGRSRTQDLAWPFPAISTASQPSITSRERFQTTYQHPEPIPKTHKHPFSESPPTMGPTDESRDDSLINPSITNDEVQYLGPAEEDEDGKGCYAIQTGLVTSKKRKTQRFSALVAAGEGKTDTRDTRELSRPSNLSIDGSYPESCNSGPALSTSSIIHDSQSLPHAAGTFSKTTILGPKGNITGSFDGTGMRAVGSSEADNSTDSAMMKSHKYERLDDERTLDQAGPSTTPLPTTPTIQKTPRKVTFAEGTQTKPAASVPTVAIVTKNGLSISEPEVFQIPTTLPKRNSLAISKLNTAKGLDKEKELVYTPHLFNYDIANPDHMKNIQALIEMSADDWSRLQSKCMTFPLREDHMQDFFDIDGASTGIKRCMRDGIASDGRYMDTAKCDNCNKWERSHAATLIRQPLKAARRPVQKEIGRKIVFWSTVIPFIGWGFLFAIAQKWEASNDLIAGFSLGVVREFGDEEIEAADYYCKCVVGGLCLLFVALLAFMITVVIES